ncbi:hypothetical protein [Flavobacterium enshiense]|uniref:Uncharacterized protein n=1 Tax=Flavobacterium enshiense DK69 TaxID=1107311 RepID=A0A0A2MSV5_9FLAO|nr:hypothetical protein [Flavobacterium enshiense]KGO95434.1 hypothetical protein Q767_11570 [Flavobacterium enshiense DK69]
MKSLIAEFRPKGIDTAKAILYCLMFVLFTAYATAQEVDSVQQMKKKKPEHPNLIKFNLTNRIFYDNTIQFTYERVIKENQSISLFGGYQEFKHFNLDLSGVNFSKSSDRSGYSIGAEYRFYLGDLNRYSAPRGVYLAPFVS